MKSHTNKSSSKTNQKPTRGAQAKHSSANQARRRFLRQTGFGLVLAVPLAMVFNKILIGGAARAADKKETAKKPPGKKTPPAGLTMADPKDPMAQALGYYEDAKKVDTKKFPKRAGAEGAKQFCNNCAFYQAKKKEDVAAPCTILQNKGVWAEGWCNSWAPKT